jgi:hypothetical protein
MTASRTTRLIVRPLSRLIPDWRDRGRFSERRSKLERALSLLVRRLEVGHE